MPAAVLWRPRVRSTLDRIACRQSDFRGFVDFLHAELDRVGPEQAVRRGTASRRCYCGNGQPEPFGQIPTPEAPGQGPVQPGTEASVVSIEPPASCPAAWNAENEIKALQFGNQ